METTVAAPASTALVPGWIGSPAYDADGAHVGHVADVLFDVHTCAAAWVLLALPRVEQRYVFAPARGLRHRVDGIQLCCVRELVRTAPPSAAPPDGLARRHALALAGHFGVRCGAGPWHGVVEPSLRGAAVRPRVAS